MKRLILLTGALLMVSCAALPAINPPAASPEKRIVCPCPYPQTPSRFIHAIEVHRGNQAVTALIGVTVIDPARRTVSCALMSTEGMVLFEAAAESGRLIVHRALPPLDSMDFARGMMSDIELLFLAPGEAPAQKGILEDGQEVCRYPIQDGWLDVSAKPGGPIRIRSYFEDGGLKRSVTLSGGMMNPYGAIELQASGIFKYALRMNLIEAEAVGRELPSPEEARGASP